MSEGVGLMGAAVSRRVALKALGVGVMGAAVGASVGVSVGGGLVEAQPPKVAPLPAPVLSALEALSPLTADAFSPLSVVRAVNTLQPLGAGAGVAALRAFLVQTRAAGREAPEGVFAVMRLLFEAPNRFAAASGSDLKTATREGYLRPPALGAPYPPPAPDPSWTPHYPVVLIADVPLSLVSGYALGGQPEPPEMHLDALCDGTCQWLAAPLAPKTPGEVRYQLMHWGGLVGEQAAIVEGQLVRLEAAMVGP